MRQRMVYGATAVLVLAVVVQKVRAADIEPARDYGCVVTLVEEVEVSARDAGVLVDLAVQPGQEVHTGDVLANLDSADGLAQVAIARRELEISRLEAESVLEIEFAKKSERIAFLEHERAKQANARAQQAVTTTDLERLQFEWEKAGLQITQAEQAKRKAELEYGVKVERLKAAEEALKKRRLIAPQDGRVVDVFRQAGEWVNPGDSVMRILRLDRLRVKAFIESSRFHPALLANCHADVTATLAGGRKERFVGLVVFVSPEVDEDGRFGVWIDVPNRRERGMWLLAPGNKADVSINVASAGRP